MVQIERCYSTLSRTVDRVIPAYPNYCGWCRGAFGSGQSSSERPGTCPLGHRKGTPSSSQVWITQREGCPRKRRSKHVSPSQRANVTGYRSQSSTKARRRPAFTVRVNSRLPEIYFQPRKTNIRTSWGHELADATIRWYRYRLGGFVRWRDRERRGDALSPSPTERIDRLGDPDVFATDRNAAEVAVDRVQ